MYGNSDLCHVLVVPGVLRVAKADAILLLNEAGFDTLQDFSNVDPAAVAQIDGFAALPEALKVLIASLPTLAMSSAQGLYLFLVPPVQRSSRL